MVFLFKAHPTYRHYAIADYLKSQGYNQALESFMKDCNVVGKKQGCCVWQVIFDFREKLELVIPSIVDSLKKNGHQ